MQAQCPNQRVLFLKGKDEYTSGEDEPSTQEKGEGERINPLEGDLLMIQRILHNQPSASIETQRENIFCSVRLTWDVSVHSLTRQLGTPSH